MPAGRSANGAGTIRKKVIHRDGKDYLYWEARYTAGYDSGTGKQIQRSVSGKTQKEVAQKLREVTVSIDEGTYTAPSKMTVGQWLDVWSEEYLGRVKPFTQVAYRGQINNHIKPAIGAVKLDSLNAHEIQKFYNDLGRSHGDLRFNPADACILPRMEKRKLHPFDEAETRDFLLTADGHRFETLFVVDLFTGMREGEILGLLWDCVDFEKGTILIDKQLQREKKKGGQYLLAPARMGEPDPLPQPPV